MGIAPKEEDVVREEMKMITDALSPEDAEKLVIMRENILEHGDYSKQVSYRSARSEACGLVTHALIDRKRPEGQIAEAQCKAEGKQTPLQVAVEKACDMMRERILDNANFDEFA